METTEKIYPGIPEDIPEKVVLVIDYLRQNIESQLSSTDKDIPEGKKISDLHCWSHFGDDVYYENDWSIKTVPMQLSDYTLAYESEEDRQLLLKDTNFMEFCKNSKISDEDILLALSMIKGAAANNYVMGYGNAEYLNSAEYRSGSVTPSWVVLPASSDEAYSCLYMNYSYHIKWLFNSSFFPNVDKLIGRININDIDGLAEIDGSLDGTNADNLINELNTNWEKYQPIINEYNKDLFDKVKNNPNGYYEYFIQTKHQAIITLATAFCMRKFNCSYEEAISAVSSAYRKQLHAIEMQ